MGINVGTKTILAECAGKFPTSLRRYQEAEKVFPSGVTHDSRYFKPFPIYISRCYDARKVDVDGNEFIDYWMGHGALLLGHNPLPIVQAVVEQMNRGTHYGACHELEILWGQWIQRLMPSAERVCFVSSGTEATMLSIRLARAFTGKNGLVRFEGHFHGWHDTVLFGYKPPYAIPSSAGLPPGIGKDVKWVPPNAIDAVKRAMAEDPDVGAVILEPAGGSSGAIPTRNGFLQELRDVCSAHGAILIFDEVITGFRLAPGGAQEYYGVKPDITALGKIVAGGLPGGAVVGRTDIMELMAFKDEPDADRYKRVIHPGTFNANPLSAAAGIAMLQIAATGKPQKRAAELTHRLIMGLNDILKSAHLGGCVYGDPAGFHLFLGQKDCDPGDSERILDVVEPSRLFNGMGPLNWPIRAALLLEGIDQYGGGRLSSAHTESDVDATVAAFERAIARVRGWGVL
jgi:glutamate-1-semialdehyde 2,1-aminomutase